MTKLVLQQQLSVADTFSSSDKDKRNISLIIGSSFLFIVLIALNLNTNDP
jgi:hypothetical protein